MFFNRFPFIRFAPPFILGVVLYHYFGKGISFSIVWIFVLVVVYGILSFKNSFRYQFLLSFLAVVLLIGAGFLRLKAHRMDNQPNHLLHFTTEIKAYKGLLIEEPAPKANSVNVRLQMIEVFTDKWQPATGIVNGYTDKALSATLEFGDILLVKGTPQPTEAPANPGEFDFRNYLIYNNIFHQQFIGENFQKVGHHVPWWKMPVAYSIKLRNNCAKIIKHNIHDPDARSVLLAITLGVKDELDPELQASFSAAGAMHVLAVSGLHVSIIYGIILLLFKHIKLTSWKRRYWMAAISIVLLWLYALITGLSPSVLRAVTMFTFVAIAKAKNTHSSIYNTLAASAFVLLCWNPYLIMSVGFQLSYLAVFGIVYLQPKFYNLLEFHNGLLDKIWAISCVSIAAQIATAPLSVLYFHQFPSYFLLSNLFIIPAAFVMLLMGLSILCFAWIPYLGFAISWLTEGFVHLVNLMVHYVRRLPGSTLEGLHLATPETWMIYAAIVMLMLLFALRRFKYLLWAFGFCLLFAVSQSLHWRMYNDNEFSVLNVSGATVLDFRVGNKSRLFADTSFTNDADRVQFHLEPKRLLAGSSLEPVEDALALESYDLEGNRLFIFQGESILLLDSAFAKNVTFTAPFQVNVVIIANESIRDLEQLLNKIEFETLIIDKSNRKFMADRLTNQAEKLNLKIHSIYRDGYYSKTWKE